MEVLRATKLQSPGMIAALRGVREDINGALMGPSGSDNGLHEVLVPRDNDNGGRTRDLMRGCQLGEAVHEVTVGVLPLRRGRNDKTAVLPQIVDFSLRGDAVHDEDGRLDNALDLTLSGLDGPTDVLE